MVRKITDLSKLDPVHAKKILDQRAQKKRAYAKRREELLARNKAWKDANPEKMTALTRAWREAHPERNAQNKRAWYDRHRDEILARQSERDKYDAENLTEKYVRESFVRSGGGKHMGLSRKDVPKEMIPLLRVTYQIKRHLREQKGGTQ